VLIPLFPRSYTITASSPMEVFQDGSESDTAHDRVIVKRIEEKESVKGGIIIPDSAKEKPMEGEIIAVGAGKR